MGNEFEIYGAHIPLSSIKDYRVLEREYIYRPSFCEKTSSLIKFFSNTKYDFVQMVPYAAILSENEYRAVMNSNNNGSVVQNGSGKNAAEVIADVCMAPVNLVKDVAVNAISSLWNSLPFGKPQSTKYYCMNTSGRVFETYLEDIPVYVTKCDGRFMEIGKDDELFAKLGDNVKSAIVNVTAFLIEADRKYLFFGDNIQLDDANEEYLRLRKQMENFRRY